MNQQELIEALKQSRAGLLAAASLDAKIAAQRPAAEEWSVIEVLAHLVDTDYFYLGEALAICDSLDHHFRYFDDEAWKATHPEVGRIELASILEALAVSHRAVIGAVARLSDAQLAQPCVHPRGIPYTTADALYRLVPHDQNHEQQITQIAAAL